ncbi:hypothetical protein AKO1_007626 [Acrasis kona]|uniref:Trafficking protein particle complex subunit n=1 Tax=Acrasis kona TaxID=1008807 RepID=A0AAW2YR33_9EUKA
MRAQFRVSNKLLPSITTLDANNNTTSSIVAPSSPGKQPLVDILDVPIKTKPKEVSMSAFSFLFSGIVQYYQERLTHGADLEQKLSDLGYSVGFRINEIILYREKNPQRKNRVIPMLQFISNTVWTMLFGKNASSLEQSTDSINRYMIYENQPIECGFISIPKNLSGLQCSYFTAGIIKGILTASEFPADVKVFPSQNKESTVFIVDFDYDVIDREELWK